MLQVEECRPRSGTSLSAPSVYLPHRSRPLMLGIFRGVGVLQVMENIRRDYARQGRQGHTKASCNDELTSVLETSVPSSSDIPSVSEC